MDLGAYIIQLVQTVIFLTPVIIIFYKQGRKDQILDDTVKDVNVLGKKVAEIKDYQSQTLTELKAEIENINSTLIRVTTVMEFIKNDFEYLRKNKEIS